jgi:uncharacterized protein (DUF2252 family)
LPEVSERITRFNDNRDSSRLHLKYKAMRESAFRFFRGTCHLFYEDIYRTDHLPQSPDAWLCGDLHLENFGSFKGSDRLAYFDLNDFDEAILGPALWELSRVITSIIVARTDAGNTINSSVTLAKDLLEAYCHTLQSGKPVTIERETSDGLVKELFETVALRRERKFLKGIVKQSPTGSKLVVDQKKYFPLSKNVRRREFIAAIQKWLNEKHERNSRRAEDVCELVTGTGSIGVNKYVVLVNKPLTGKKYLLVVKEALPSSLQPYIHTPQPAWKNEAERICAIQYRMQHVTPGDLDTFSFKDNWYVTKWVQPIADKINIDEFIDEKDKQISLMNTFGRLAASAQLRSSGRDGSAIADELIRFGSGKEWIPALLDFAKAYTATVKKDYRDYCRDYDKGYFNFKK